MRSLVCRSLAGVLGSPAANCRLFPELDFSLGDRPFPGPVRFQFILPFRALPFRVCWTRSPVRVRGPEPTQRTTYQGSGPSSRHHGKASTSARLPSSSLRSVPRLSQPLDGFLRLTALGPVSSRATSRVRQVQGLLPPRSARPSSGGAAPLPLRRRPLTAPESYGCHSVGPRLRGLLPHGDAFRRRGG